MGNFPNVTPVMGCIMEDKADLAVLTADYPTPVWNRDAKKSPNCIGGETGSTLRAAQYLIQFSRYGLY